ncbi:MAG: 1,4-dihydroxy-2-naphthoate polyprenyltransferase [Ignavibacteriales bacterium]|nr:1,4-dihydroxy-2-naphthoate polyprenyltransferase [Ignavibacteriales bacterium]MCF8435796.1 1,4-dihydroxy-2-naphthoate polyprenyltransferase [Ignavibacteriales bacterium]
MRKSEHQINATAIKLSQAQIWFLASRPKTLLAAVVPVIIGTSVASYSGKLDLLPAIVSLICSILIQTGTNFVNDLYDFYSGADRKDRVGPLRVVSNGLVSPETMKLAIYLVFGLSFLLGMYLVYNAGWFILFIGILSILAGYAYTAGPYPLAYNGLGDIFVFIFFGFIGTVGTFYVQALEITPFAIWASVPAGALITNILVVNNYRDIKQDKLSGKNTLAVKFGETFSRIQYLGFMFVSYMVPVIVFFTFKNNLLIFLPFLSLPLAIRLIKMIFSLKGKDLNKTLELTAKLSAIYGTLFSIGILL